MFCNIQLHALLILLFCCFIFGLLLFISRTNDDQIVRNAHLKWRPDRILKVSKINIEFPFPQLPTNFLSISAWVLTHANVSSTHRFFDTSPFSPNSKYIAITQTPVEYELSYTLDSYYGKLVNIVILELASGRLIRIGSSNAWSSQTGSHVQWRSDSELVYNKIVTVTDGKKSTFKYKAISMKVNIETGEKKELQCPVYQVSNSGRYGAAPVIIFVSPLTNENCSLRIRTFLTLNPNTMCTEYDQDACHAVGLRH